MRTACGAISASRFWLADTHVTLIQVGALRIVRCILATTNGVATRIERITHIRGTTFFIVA